ncbi:hypothetical protein SBI_09989 [Streptomyces bingchenggensis BCW-1]|uniref:Uncharacterized protein n=1 Tax=Streptomyces bingchenggensis (strain BCW-1) TaxID=749414 RepID=D7CF91_STRBB|nr:hypothetical protein SBI_09989 [Streptomyces bingchenggensis BCW-1]
MFVRLLYKMTRKLISLPSTLLRSDAAKDAERAYSATRMRSCADS